MQKTVKVTMNMPYARGYEYTGEYRHPREGEYYYSGRGVELAAAPGNPADFAILRRGPDWQPLTAEALFKLASDKKYIQLRWESTHEVGMFELVTGIPDSLVFCEGGAPILKLKDGPFIVLDPELEIEFLAH